jgi:hypothetical protein
MNRIKDSVKAKMKHKYSLNKSTLQPSTKKYEQVKSSQFYKNIKSKSPIVTRTSTTGHRNFVTTTPKAATKPNSSAHSLKKHGYGHSSVVDLRSKSNTRIGKGLQNY